MASRVVRSDRARFEVMVLLLVRKLSELSFETTRKLLISQGHSSAVVCRSDE